MPAYRGQLPMSLLYRCLACVLVGAVAGMSHAADSLPRVPSTEPADALVTFHLQDGFRLELLAAEPLVTDPVAMVYDENGRAYVVEMNDYPYTDPSLDKAWEDQQSAAIGRVRVLEDDNGDGVFDRSTVFAEGLSWPTGIACWKGGVFVTATPDIWYFKDTDGDRVADVREQVFTGFRKFNVQAVINNLQWGLDGKLYAAGSSNGGSIVRTGGDGQPIAIGRNDFRFDPETGAFEVLSGGARFGNTFDDWGNRFICNIRNPVQHIVLDDHYLKLNPLVAAATTIHDSADAGDAVPVFRISPPEPWREVNAARLAAENRAGTPRSEMHAVGFVTSTAGATVYRGGAYPEEYAGNVFVGEVAGNLVLRYRLEPEGATFRAVRTDDDEEFLASKDNWFRPVNFINAPDGTLHMLDMYRETIEHPWSMPDDIKAQLDLTSGRDRGRIYRLVPPVYRDGYTAPSPPRFGEATTAELVATLENPNSWWRETAQRLLRERQNDDAVALLRDLVLHSEMPVARVHALYALDSLAGLTDGDIVAALRDASPRVREHAIRFAEPRVPMMATSAELRERLSELIRDDDARVRQQAILTLAAIHDPNSARDARALMRHDAADRWLRLSARIAMDSQAAGVVLAQQLRQPRRLEEQGASELVRELLEQLLAAGPQADLAPIIQAILALPQTSPFDPGEPRLALLLMLSERLPDIAPLIDVASQLGDEARQQIVDLHHAAERIAPDPSAPIDRRMLSIRWLGCRPLEESGQLLANLVSSQEPQEVQRAAIDALAKSSDPTVAGILLKRHPQLSPA
ncbi:MAG: hypothetical protein JNG89_00405, partial [Planctomycetaceae bacterium]|nr:hypothetical protein [Planctomycetaceae bacterium]